MSDISKEDMEEACTAISSMIDRSEKAQKKFSHGTSQYTLQKNRINALKIALSLITAEITNKKTINEFEQDDLDKAVAPITSLISKSEKAIGKLSQETWQYRMLKNNLKALYIALPLLKNMEVQDED